MFKIFLAYFCGFFNLKSLPAYFFPIPSYTHHKVHDYRRLLASFADVAGINGNSPSSLFTKEALGK